MAGSIYMDCLISVLTCGSFYKHLELVGPLTLKFDRVTWPFLKIDMRYEAYRHGKNINEMTGDIP